METLVVIDEKDYFGHCVHPEHENYYCNIHKTQIMYCDTCKIYWIIGDIFGSWRFENEEIWQRNAKKLRGYQEVPSNAFTVKLRQ